MVVAPVHSQGMENQSVRQRQLFGVQDGGEGILHQRVSGYALALVPDNPPTMFTSSGSASAVCRAKELDLVWATPL